MDNNNKSLPDELNPDLIFNSTNSGLLVDAANGKIDLKELAIRELENRGLNPNTGAWRGFRKQTVYKTIITE